LHQNVGEQEVKLGAAKGRVPHSNRRVIGKVFRAAASLILLATLSLIVWEFIEKDSPKEIANLQTTASEEIKKVILADKSIVWLKGNSSLTYPEEFSEEERKISLQGEALFEVTNDPDRPFIIQCGELTTKVLSTSFSI